MANDDSKRSRPVPPAKHQEFHKADVSEPESAEAGLYEATIRAAADASRRTREHAATDEYPPHYLHSPASFAEWANIARITVIRGIERNEGPIFMKLYGRWRLKHADAQAWVDACRQAALDSRTK